MRKWHKFTKLPDGRNSTIPCAATLLWTSQHYWTTTKKDAATPIDTYHGYYRTCCNSQTMLSRQFFTWAIRYKVFSYERESVLILVQFMPHHSLLDTNIVSRWRNAWGDRSIRRGRDLQFAVVTLSVGNANAGSIFYTQINLEKAPLMGWLTKTAKALFAHKSYAVYFRYTTKSTARQKYRISIGKEYQIHRIDQLI